MIAKIPSIYPGMSRVIIVYSTTYIFSMGLLKNGIYTDVVYEENSLVFFNLKLEMLHQNSIHCKYISMYVSNYNTMLSNIIHILPLHVYFESM